MDTIKTAHTLVFRDDQVLLVRHGEAASHLTGTYGIPGGRFDKGESVKQAAKREMQEETGLTVEAEDLLEFPDNQYTADLERKGGKIKRFTMIVFIGKKFKGELKSTEETTPEWVGIDKLNGLNLLPNCAKAVSDAQNFLKNHE